MTTRHGRLHYLQVQKQSTSEYQLQESSGGRGSGLFLLLTELPEAAGRPLQGTLG